MTCEVQPLFLCENLQSQDPRSSSFFSSGFADFLSQMRTWGQDGDINQHSLGKAAGAHNPQVQGALLLLWAPARLCSTCLFIPRWVPWPRRGRAGVGNMCTSLRSFSGKTTPGPLIFPSATRVTWPHPTSTRQRRAVFSQRALGCAPTPRVTYRDDVPHGSQSPFHQGCLLRGQRLSLLVRDPAWWRHWFHIPPGL